MNAVVEFVWWGGLHSHFHVQPNFSVEVALCCVVVGVVTILQKLKYTISVLSWTTVLDYIKSLKKSSSDVEKKSLNNKNEEIVNGCLPQQTMMLSAKSLPHTQKDIYLSGAWNEIQLTTANLNETLI